MAGIFLWSPEFWKWRGNWTELSIEGRSVECEKESIWDEVSEKEGCEDTDENGITIELLQKKKEEVMDEWLILSLMCFWITEKLPGRGEYLAYWLFAKGRNDKNESPFTEEIVCLAFMEICTVGS